MEDKKFYCFNKRSLDIEDLSDFLEVQKKRKPEVLEAALNMNDRNGNVLAYAIDKNQPEMEK